jgi:hypothetical protein
MTAYGAESIVLVLEERNAHAPSIANGVDGRAFQVEAAVLLSFIMPTPQCWFSNDEVPMLPA